MSSDTGSEQVAWGSSRDLFGSNAADDQDDVAPAPGRSSGAGRRSGSGSFGSRSASEGRKRQSGRGTSRRRSSFDDPFGPVVGASADAESSEDASDGAFERAAEGRDVPGSDGDTGSGRSGRSRSRRAADRGSRQDRAGADVMDDAEPVKSDEEWASLGRAVMLRQLALGPRSRHQLDRKLVERDVPPAIATALLDRFEEVQLIDDAEFARIWVRSRAATKGLARSSIRRELAEKGVDPDIAEDALAQLSDEDELDQARDIVRRKHRGSADLSDRAVRDKEIRRLVGVLARKGYSPGVGFAIVKGVLAETEASTDR